MDRRAGVTRDRRAMVTPPDPGKLRSPDDIRWDAWGQPSTPIRGQESADAQAASLPYPTKGEVKEEISEHSDGKPCAFRINTPNHLGRDRDPVPGACPPTAGEELTLSRLDHRRLGDIAGGHHRFHYHRRANLLRNSVRIENAVCNILPAQITVREAP